MIMKDTHAAKRIVVPARTSVRSGLRGTIPGAEETARHDVEIGSISVIVASPR